MKSMLIAAAAVMAALAVEAVAQATKPVAGRPAGGNVAISAQQAKDIAQEFWKSREHGPITARGDGVGWTLSAHCQAERSTLILRLDANGRWENDGAALWGAGMPPDLQQPASAAATQPATAPAGSPGLDNTTFLPGSNISVLEALRTDHLALVAVCEPGHPAVTVGNYTQWVRQDIKIVKVLWSYKQRSAPQREHFEEGDQLSVNYSYHSTPGEGPLSRRAICIVKMRAAVNDWGLVKALPDTPENQKAVMGALPDIRSTQTRPAATEPATKQGKERMEKSLASLDKFQVIVEYHGNRDLQKPYYSLTLRAFTPQGKEQRPPSWPADQVTEDQARKIIQRLAGEGYFDKAVDFNLARRGMPNGPLYVLRLEGATDLWLNLGWDIGTIKYLQKLSPLLDGQAAKDMAKLIERLDLGNNAERMGTREQGPPMDRGRHAAQPASQPAADPQPSTKAGKERMAKFLADLDKFTLDLTYLGAQDKPFYNLTLRGPGVMIKDERSVFSPADQLTREEARKIIEQFASQGYFDKARNVADKDIKRPDGPTYVLELRGPKNVELWLDLGWDLSMVEYLEKLSGALDGQAAKDMATLLGRLGGLKKQWQAEAKAAASTQPATATK